MTNPMMPVRIQSIQALEILDSRASPTIECTVTLTDGSSGRAAVPSGASVGSQEVLELRDHQSKRYHGRGVLGVIDQMHALIHPALEGQDPFDQVKIDDILINLDGTPQKSKLGGNAILSASLAVAHAAASSIHQPLYRYLGGDAGCMLPMPLLNILNGGAHADNALDIQEIMIVPVSASSYQAALEMSVKVYQALKTLLLKKGLRITVGDEGGFAPEVTSNTEALNWVLQAIEAAGFKPGQDIAMALDVAASEFYTDGYYHLGSEHQRLDSAEWVERIQAWVQSFPIVSIEDGMAEQDWAGWSQLTQALGQHIQLVGDDVFVTQRSQLERAIEQGAANAILIKPNQVGTLSETLSTMRCAQAARYGVIVSHRSGETEDTSIVDLSVGLNAGQIKIGAPARERALKYNQLLRIESDLGHLGLFSSGQALYNLN